MNQSDVSSRGTTPRRIQLSVVFLFAGLATAVRVVDVVADVIGFADLTNPSVGLSTR